MVTSAQHGRGVASTDLDRVRDRVEAAWTMFLSLADSVDLDRRTRLPGWRAHDLLVHLGTWPDKDSLADALASARTGLAGSTVDPDLANAAVVAAHGRESPDAVLAALRLTRDRTVALLHDPEFTALATTEAATWLGPLPLASFVHAICFELAVHALDLAEAGAPKPPELLLDAGVAALADATGALAARHGVDVAVALATPYGGWAFAARDGGWVTQPAAQAAVPAKVRGTARDVLEASSGRAAVPKLLLLRRLKVSDLGELLKLGRLVEQVPTLPGGPMLAKAVGTLSGVATRLPGLRG